MDLIFYILSLRSKNFPSSWWTDCSFPFHGRKGKSLTVCRGRSAFEAGALDGPSPSSLLSERRETITSIHTQEKVWMCLPLRAADEVMVRGALMPLERRLLGNRLLSHRSTEKKTKKRAVSPRVRLVAYDRTLEEPVRCLHLMLVTNL